MWSWNMLRERNFLALFRNKVENHELFAESEAAVLFKKLLQTVEYLHSNHIMHKDIKPRKILITTDGEMKLIDFGLSKWKSFGSLHTTTGTPYYLAPEVMKGVKTSKSDIWSWGVILYWMLSGTLPFIGDGEKSIFQKTIEGSFSFENKIWDNISSDAKDLISKMLNTNYNNRYSATDWLSHEWFNSSSSFKIVRKNTKNLEFIPSTLSSFQVQIGLQAIAAKLIRLHINLNNLSLLK